jgi:predicted kinase
MPTCYQLIGVPGSGKSTWIQNQEWAKDCSIASTDMWVDLEAERVGKTYSEIFDEYMPKALKLMVNHVELARDKGMDIIWDQTSITLASRRRKFNMLPKYDHIAVIFKTPEPEELTRRLASRPGKTIPDSVMKRMIEGFDPVELEEGYSEIWHAS